jgi:hypothetical protein
MYGAIPDSFQGFFCRDYPLMLSVLPTVFVASILDSKGFFRGLLSYIKREGLQ